MGTPIFYPTYFLDLISQHVRFIVKETLTSAVFCLTAHVQRNILTNYKCKQRIFTAALTGTSWITSVQLGSLL